MKLSRKAKYIIAASLLLFLAAQLASSLIRSNGTHYSLSHSVFVCGECAVILHKQDVTVLGLPLKRAWTETTILHDIAMFDAPHSWGDHIPGYMVEMTEIAFSFRGLTRQQLITPPSALNRDVYVYQELPPYGGPVPSFNQDYVSLPGQSRIERVQGFWLHADTNFARAFARLRREDKSWSEFQFGVIQSSFTYGEFPRPLLPFATNKNEEALFELLQTTNLNNGRPRDTNEFPLPR